MTEFGKSPLLMFHNWRRWLSHGHLPYDAVSCHDEGGGDLLQELKETGTSRASRPDADPAGAVPTDRLSGYQAFDAEIAGTKFNHED